MAEPAADAAPYAGLTPDVILAAVESQGLACDGHIHALNSYENRVFQIGIEDAPALVAKFYRPGRWSDAAILEEHAYAQELATAELPVVAPWANAAGATLHDHAGFRFTLFPRRGGRQTDPDIPGHREWLGRLIGRMHLIGRSRRFVQRQTLDRHTYGERARAHVLASSLLPTHLERRYVARVDALLAAIAALEARLGPPPAIRLHGDCHAGNVLWTDAGPHFVDLDDCCMGPAIQDLWMLAGDRAGLHELLDGYEQFADFDWRELHWIEALRTLRMVHYAGWLARRWGDPAFPAAFPWFGNEAYWTEHLAHLDQQMELLAGAEAAAQP